MKKFLSHTIIKGVMSAALLLFMTFSLTFSAFAATDGESSTVSLSAFWNKKVLRWESLIVESANLRQLDPDFLASLVWMESRGDPYAVGPVGAIGLMQVMPKEAGFKWRPSRDALLDPGINLFWGSRTLATVISQGQGDVFNALAAYNGGWDQVMYRGPTIFATTILRDYAHAIALRHDVQGEWLAFIARKDIQIRGPIWIADSVRTDVYYYGSENLLPEGTPLIPDVAPSSVIAYSKDDKNDGSFIVGIWLYDVQKDAWHFGPSPVGSLYMIEKTSPAVAAAQTGDNSEPAVKPTSSSVPSQAPSLEETPESEFICPGGDLQLDAWPLHTVVNESGWTATIYAEGKGGDCHYTYAWNVEDDVKGVIVGEAITFDIHTPRRDATIVGTVVVSSAGESVRRQLYIPAPKK